MRRTSLLAILLLTLSIFSLPALWNLILPVNAVSASFSFAASGDMGSLTVSTSTTSLNRLATANPSFFLSLGDELRPFCHWGCLVWSVRVRVQQHRGYARRSRHGRAQFSHFWRDAQL